MREIVLDTETTGLNVEQGDRIIDIACIELIDKEPTGNIFQQYIYPEKTISDEIVNLTGLTNDFLKDKPKFIEIVDDFLEFIGNDPIIAHNAKFDINFINHELKKISYQLLNNHIIDTLAIAKKKFQSNFSLNALCKRYKISLDSRKFHGALVDAKLLAKLYGFLCFEEDILDFSTNNNQNENFIVDFPYRPPKILTNKELEIHRDFLIKLKIDEF